MISIPEHTVYWDLELNQMNGRVTELSVGGFSIYDMYSVTLSPVQL